jgi:hypothetical protein
MMFVHKFPNPHTLASTSFSSESPGEEWELMSEVAFESWKTEQLNQGWMAQKTPEELAAETRKVWPNGEAFLRCMTLEELAAISLCPDPTIAALRLLLVARQAQVWSDDQELNLGLNRLVQLNLLTVERKTSILTQ